MDYQHGPKAPYTTVYTGVKGETLLELNPANSQQLLPAQLVPHTQNNPTYHTHNYQS